MAQRLIILLRVVFPPLVAAILSILLIGCVSSRQALQMESRVNCAIMKNLQDNDEDLFQIEDGTGAVGEAAACPT